VKWVGAGLHRNWTLAFSDPVPDGGLTVNLASSDPTIASVPSAIIVPVGTTFVAIPVTGLVVGVVQITASAPGWTGDVEEVAVVTPTVYFYPYGVQTSRTTSSAPDPISVTTYTPGCGICDLANADITVHFTVTGSPASIVAITPATVTIKQNDYLSEIASVGTPTSTGTYTITASATGFDSLTSATVTVTP
jgi:hypothetical protein